MIAVPITAESITGALEQIQEANKVADVIELRLDYLEKINESIMQELMQKAEKPVIVTFRKLNHGALIKDSERLSLLKKAIKSKAQMVDFEVETSQEIIQEAILSKQASQQIILSFHDFEKTPPLEELTKIVKKMKLLNADVFKIVTFATNNEDSERVLSLIPRINAIHKKAIAFCMGEKGMQSRVECMKKGAFLTFASLKKGKESAPGQLTIKQVRDFLSDKNGKF